VAYKNSYLVDHYQKNTVLVGFYCEDELFNGIRNLRSNFLFLYPLNQKLNLKSPIILPVLYF